MPLPRPQAPARRADLPFPLGLIRRDAHNVRTVRKAVDVHAIERTTSAEGKPAYGFVISSGARDLMNDEVVQSGREDVSERIPAQLDHSGNMRDLVGHWESIQVKDNRTTAKLVPLDQGMNAAADMVRALLDAGVRLAASIGFTSIKREWIREPDTDDGRIVGMRFLRWKLVEASIVVVPANPDALSLAKSMLPAATRAGFDEFVRTHSRRSPLPSRAAAAAGANPRPAAMSIAERIAEARRLLAEQRAALSTARERLAENEDDDDLVTDIENLSHDIARTERTLRALGDAESTQAATAVAAGAARTSGARSLVRVAVSGDGEVIDLEPVRRAPARIERRGDATPSADYIVRAALCAYESFLSRSRETIDDIVARRYPNDESTRAVTGIFTRAAQSPAMTTVPGWAAELTRNSYGAYMELMARRSVVPNLPLVRQEFNGFAKITFPRRKVQANPNLAAAFRREGDPIRVGALTLTSADLTPKSMAVISTFTNELFERSTPNIEVVIRGGMIRDTAQVLDGIFLDANPAVAGLRPAGIQNGVAAPNTAASTGATPAQALADIKARLAQLFASGFGDEPVWIMNTQRWTAIKLMQNAMGTAAFPEAATNGTLAGYPVADSLNVPADVVFLVDASVIPFAGGAPMFSGTDVATIHEEGVTPLPIVDNAGTPVTAHPVRSLWQTNSSGIRSIWELDWVVATDPNAGAVQTITGVAW